MIIIVIVYYDEVRDVLDEEGGLDEDVDVGFFVVVLEVVVVVWLVFWELIKGLLLD